MIIANRDFNGVVIPSAMPIIVIAGTEVEIIQNKGSFVTIYTNGNLVRVGNKDLDAIGLTRDTTLINQKNSLTKQELTKESLLELAWQGLRECYDPEIPVNIVDLGLVYDCQVVENKATVTMTLTAPMCGMGPILVNDIKEKLLEIEQIKDVIIEMVFDPPWSIDRMSDAAKVELGLI